MFTRNYQKKEFTMSSQIHNKKRNEKISIFSLKKKKKLVKKKSSNNIILT